ncbi:hypothetical protein DRN74_00165 [Candidatus Micrarchaeota archaeon]|nr:MAG: hypothetical protein DRN74_00165 [Candidatus Micrarchaeota archaeon]
MKGFSLFTPLVGSMMMITAIIISMTMIQSDAHSAKSFNRVMIMDEARMQARIIQAGVSSSLLINIEKAINKVVEDVINRGAVSCNSNRCEHAIKGLIKSKLEEKDKEIFYASAHGDYENVWMDIAGMISNDYLSGMGCSGQDRLEKYMNCLSNALSNQQQSSSLIEANWRGETLTVRINPPQPGTELAELFNIKANVGDSSTPSTITVNVLPRAISYERDMEISCTPCDSGQAACSVDGQQITVSCVSSTGGGFNRI